MYSVLHSFSKGTKNNKILNSALQFDKIFEEIKFKLMNLLCTQFCTIFKRYEKEYNFVASLPNSILFFFLICWHTRCNPKHKIYKQCAIS